MSKEERERLLGLPWAEFIVELERWAEIEKMRFEFKLMKNLDDQKCSNR